MKNTTERRIYRILKKFPLTRGSNMMLYANYAISLLIHRTDDVERAFMDIFIYPEERNKYGIESFGRIMQIKNKVQTDFPELRYKKKEVYISERYNQDTKGQKTSGGKIT